MLQTIQTTSQVFVPRQRLVLAQVTRSNITIYLYNLTRECQERLVRYNAASYWSRLLKLFSDWSGTSPVWASGSRQGRA